MRRACTLIATAGLLGATLAGCMSGARESPAVPRAADTGLDRMERLALTADRCWFKSRDAAFRSFTLAPELSSYSGRPRFLLVPRGRPEARPLLVVEGRSGSAAVTTYGPALASPLGGRIDADIRRWSAGSGRCDA